VKGLRINNNKITIGETGEVEEGNKTDQETEEDFRAYRIDCACSFE
jgi:hypothetical protein